MAIRILIADDHGVIRAGMRAVLEKESDFQIVGEAADGLDAQSLAVALKPDILLLDINMPGADGIQITRELTATVPQVRILILTLHEGVSMLREAMTAGAAGYIVKKADDVEVVGAINTVMRGEMYVHPSMMQALVRDMSPRAEIAKPSMTVLTPRETEVLRLIARGQTNRQIAKTLTLSVRTVDTHRANLMNKLSARNREELVQYAIEHHLMD
ncbi:MAG: response regulator transcription factor [Chloroflexi bacterium]|nr:response regulator transcription factor [Chloroflexota bacterium]